MNRNKKRVKESNRRPKRATVGVPNGGYYITRLENENRLMRDYIFKNVFLPTILTPKE